MVTSVSSISAAAPLSSTAASTYPSFAPGSIQELIATTLEIPSHLTDRSKRDLRLSYAKYEAYLEATKSMSKLVTLGTWTPKFTNDDIIEIFFSKSAYFKWHSKIFPFVKKYPAMQKWLCNDDAPYDAEVWGHKKQTFENLKEILDNCKDPSDLKKKPALGGKGKGRGGSRDSDKEHHSHKKVGSSKRSQNM